MFTVRHWKTVPMSRFKIFRLRNLLWIFRYRAWSPYYLVRYARFIRLNLFGPRDVVCLGFVFLGKGVELSVRKGFGRIVIEPWVHIGDHNRIRAHEGTVSIGTKSVFGRDNTVNAYLSVIIGAECIFSDSIYVCDFDHRLDNTEIPIRQQGIIKSPVVIESDVWIGTKVTILRGSKIGRGSVIGANSVVKGNFAPMSIAGGVPARLIRSRLKPTQASHAQAEHQAYVDALTQEALKDSTGDKLGSITRPGQPERE